MSGYLGRVKGDFFLLSLYMTNVIITNVNISWEPDLKNGYYVSNLPLSEN